MSSDEDEGADYEMGEEADMRANEMGSDDQISDEDQVGGNNAVSGDESDFEPFNYEPGSATQKQVKKSKFDNLRGKKDEQDGLKKLPGSGTKDLPFSYSLSSDSDSFGSGTRDSVLEELLKSGLMDKYEMHEEEIFTAMEEVKEVTVGAVFKAIMKRRRSLMTLSQRLRDVKKRLVERKMFQKKE